MKNAYRTLVCGDLREGDHLQDPGVDGRIIRTRILKELDEGSMNWTDLAQDRDRWRALVNVVMNLRVQSTVRNSLTS